MDADANERHPATKASRVLIVEPNIRLRRAVQTLLELEGYLVWPALDVDSGLAVLRVAHWPLVVLLSVSPADVPLGDAHELLLRAITTAGAPQWPQHAFLVATTSPEYLCAVVDWLPEGLSLPVLRQPYNVEHLLRTVALTAHSLELMQKSARRLLPSRHAPGIATGHLLPPPAVAAPQIIPTHPAYPAGSHTTVDAWAAARVSPAALLHEDIGRLHAIAEQTQQRLRHTGSVMEAGYTLHKRVVLGNR